MTNVVKIDELMARSGVAFGTSGARGTVEAMTDPVCYAYTRAFLQALQNEGAIRPAAKVMLAGDLRPSTPRILTAVARAITDAGYQAEYAGPVPSPAVAYYAMTQGSASVMVTGSHIPDDRNGIKFNRPDGEILKPDEARMRAQQVTLPAPFPQLDDTDLPTPTTAARLAYVERYLNFFPPNALAGLRVAVYEHSGVGRDVLKDILQGLGAEVTGLARSERFIPVDTEAIRAEDIALARDWAQQHHYDAIVSTDGDADRPLIADEQGQWLRGDIVGVLCARYLGIDTLVTPVSSNSAVEQCGWFSAVYRTRIGSPYVIERMQQAMLTGGAVAGYEANGGFLLATDVQQQGRVLKALPTRDAVLPILSLLTLARAASKPLSALLADLPKRYTASDRLKNFPTELAQARIQALSESTTAIEAAFGTLCGRVKHTDTTDGLRIRFDNDEIVHLRPSGNAPELRCYNEATSTERAQALNQACLALLASWV